MGLILCLVATIAISVFAAEPPILLKHRPTEASVGEILKLEPVQNHHFNLAAPQKCGTESWLQKSELFLTCRISKPGSHLMRVSICDNEKTFCKQEKFTILVKSPS